MGWWGAEKGVFLVCQIGMHKIQKSYCNNYFLKCLVSHHIYQRVSHSVNQKFLAGCKRFCPPRLNYYMASDTVVSGSRQCYSVFVASWTIIYLLASMGRLPHGTKYQSLTNLLANPCHQCHQRWQVFWQAVWQSGIQTDKKRLLNVS